MNTIALTTESLGHESLIIRGIAALHRRRRRDREVARVAECTCQEESDVAVLSRVDSGEIGVNGDTADIRGDASTAGQLSSNRARHGLIFVDVLVCDAGEGHLTALNTPSALMCSIPNQTHALWKPDNGVFGTTLVKVCTISSGSSADGTDSLRHLSRLAIEDSPPSGGGDVGDGLRGPGLEVC